MKCISSEKGRLPKSIFGDFWWFLGSPGEAKNKQKWKNCLPRIDRKKGGKKGGDPTRCWSSAAAFARLVGMQDSCSGRFLPWFLIEDLPTPPLPAECGGLSSLTRRPPHSTKLLALIHVKKLIRILAVSARTSAIHGRILPQKMQRRSPKTMSRNHENSSKDNSQNTKNHQNEQKGSPGAPKVTKNHDSDLPQSRKSTAKLIKNGTVAGYARSAPG